MSLADDIRAMKDAPASNKVVHAQACKKPSNGKAISKANFTDRQFAHALIKHSMNAKAAYKELKPDVTDGTAGVEGHKRLKKPNVIKILTPMLEDLFTRAGIEVSWVFQRWVDMSQATAADYFTIENGKPRLDMSAMTHTQRANLKEITITPTQYGDKITVKTYDAQKAVDQIARHLGLLVEKMADEDVERIGDLIERGVNRIRETKDLDGWKDIVLDVESSEVR